MPWKITTIGDPLMLIAPPTDGVKARLQEPADDGADVREQTVALLRDLVDGGDARAAAEAIKALVLLGRDEMAAHLWPLARRANADAGADAARAALGPLFRLQRREAFIEAWGMLDSPTETEKDMLWHLFGPRIRGIDDEQTLVLLEGAVRGPLVHLDLERLLPAIEAAFGRDHAIELIRRHRASATNEHDREQLEAMLERRGVVVENGD